MVPEPFRCDVVRDRDRGTALPFGELDLNTAHLVDAELAALREAGCTELRLDLRGVTFMDSTGLRLALRWDNAARAEGFGFAVVPGPETVHRVFRLTGMDDHLTFVEA